MRWLADVSRRRRAGRDGVWLDMLRLVATVLIPIPDTDFDPTEVAVSWQVLGTPSCSAPKAAAGQLPTTSRSPVAAWTSGHGCPV